VEGRLNIWLGMQREILRVLLRVLSAISKI